MKFVRSVATRMNNGSLTWNSPVSDLKYVGPYITQQIQTRVNVGHVPTLDELANHFAHKVGNHAGVAAVDPLVKEIAKMTKNQRAYSAIQLNDGSQELARPINRMGFNALADLVGYAFRGNHDNDYGVNVPANIVGRLVCTFNEHLDINNTNPNTPCRYSNTKGNVGKGARGMRKCPVRPTRAQCESDNLCEWSQNACIAKNARYNKGHWAPDEPPYGGDWARTNNQKRPGKRYVNAPQDQGYLFALGDDSDDDDDDDNDDDDDQAGPSTPSPPPPSRPRSQTGRRKSTRAKQRVDYRKLAGGGQTRKTTTTTAKRKTKTGKRKTTTTTGKRKNK